MSFQTATCHGCSEVVYTAPGGQLPLKPYPHVRCGALSRDIPMILGEHQKYLGNEVPDDCPLLERARDRHRRR